MITPKEQAAIRFLKDEGNWRINESSDFESPYMLATPNQYLAYHNPICGSLQVATRHCSSHSKWSYAFCQDIKLLVPSHARVAYNSGIDYRNRCLTVFLQVIGQGHLMVIRRDTLCYLYNNMTGCFTMLEPYCEVLFGGEPIIKQYTTENNEWPRPTVQHSVTDPLPILETDAYDDEEDEFYDDLGAHLDEI